MKASRRTVAAGVGTGEGTTNRQKKSAGAGGEQHHHTALKRMAAPITAHCIGLLVFTAVQCRRAVDGIPAGGGQATFDTADAIERAFPFFFGCMLLYFPVVFGLRAFMSRRRAFDLKLHSPVNVVFWWNQLQAVFSTLACLFIAPLIYRDVTQHSMAYSTCNPHIHTKSDGAWICYLYAISKMVELGDTVLIVLRKRELKVLQYGHHWVTMIYVWFSSRYTLEVNHLALYMGAMNLFVHACMYSWYAVSAVGVIIPEGLSLALTSLQFIQMIIATYFIAVASHCKLENQEHAEVFLQQQRLGIAMYVWYIMLFGHLLWTKCGKLAQKRPAKQSMQ